MKTNKPLYLIRRGETYTLTYDDLNLPKHYRWKGKSRLAELEKHYAVLMSGGVAQTPEVADSETRRIIAALDDRGRWISNYGGERLVGHPGRTLSLLCVSESI